MDELNYHHLRYFHAVAAAGSVAEAAERLFVSQPTVSGQIKELEKSLGQSLFKRSGRSLVLTDVGSVVYEYAEDIFSTGRELMDILQDRETDRVLKIKVGAGMMVPKLVVFRLLSPALSLDQRVELSCHEGTLTDLLSDLAAHKLDVVLSDRPLGPENHVKAFNHLLGESTMTIFAPPNWSRKLKKDFPDSLNDTPFLLPLQGSAVRRSFDTWCEQRRININMIGAFADSALIKVFGQNGMGAFLAPTAIGEEVVTQFGCEPIAEIEDVRERYYAISVERRLRNPAVLAISEQARGHLFSDS